MKDNKKKDKNNTLLVVGILLIVGIISIGYATLRTQLKINGTANIGGATWSVYFSNVTATSQSNVTPTTIPSVSGTSTTTLNYGVNLAKPGDIYQFRATVKNDGSIDAKLEDDVILAGLGAITYVRYTATYSDGSAILQDDELAAGDSVDILVTVEYAADLINNDNISEDPVSLNLSCTLNYVQK